MGGTPKAVRAMPNSTSNGRQALDGERGILRALAAMICLATAHKHAISSESMDQLLLEAIDAPRFRERRSGGVCMVTATA